MMKRLALTLTLAAASPALAAPVSFTVVSPDSYQSFVENWTPATRPLCALISSADEWNKVMHPAPVMHAAKPPSPDAAFWTSHMLLLIARVIPAGGAVEPFIAPAVNSHGRTLSVAYRFLTPAPASSTTKDYLALAVPRSAPTSVVFTQNSHVVCILRPARGLWVSPASAAAPAA
jgi:hypothetical protein